MLKSRVFAFVASVAASFSVLAGSPEPVPSVFDSLSNLISGVKALSNGAGSSGTIDPPSTTPAQNHTSNSECPALSVSAWMGEESVTSGPWRNGGDVKVQAPVIMPAFTLPAGGAGDMAQVFAIECPEYTNMTECQVGYSSNYNQVPIHKIETDSLESEGKPITISTYGVYVGTGTFHSQNTYMQKFVCDPQTFTWTLKRRSIDVPRDFS